MLESPLIRTLVISLLFGVGSAFTLVKLTRPALSAEQKPEKITENVVSENAVECWVTIRSAHPMESVRIYRENNPETVEDISETEYEAEIMAEGELTFKLLVSWPEGTPETAVMISVEPVGQDTMTETVWAQNKLTREFSFPISKPEE